MKKLLFTLLFLTLGTAWGGVFEDGLAADKRQDYKEAVRLYRLAAEQGHAKAQSNLGLMYAKGHGVTQDYKEAIRLYRLSVAQGDAGAQTNLGVMYAQGQGVTQDYKEAIRLYRLAAGQGDAVAQNSLGEMYRDGKGAAQDYTHAYMWFNLASSAGDTDATKNRDLAAKKMTPQQIEKAQEMAKACQAGNLKGC